jgi:YD repeat-containing protein
MWYRRAMNAHIRWRMPRVGLCYLLAFVFLFGPECFQQLAQADVLYSNLTTCTWAKKDTAVHYLYDGNGSVEFKYTAAKNEANWQTTYTEKVQYTYDLAGRLKSVATTPYGGSTETTTYAYNHNGVRVSQTKGTTVTTYLVDESNPTGYSQTLEECTKVSGTQTKLEFRGHHT